MTHLQIELAKMNETRRANLQQETLKGLELQEVQRANLAHEAMNTATLSETSRHNVSMEELERNKQSETQRSNLARESENHRSNVASETLRANELSETRRSNISKEGETHRSNVVKEAENKRSNVAKETETKRSNLENEKLTGQKNLAQAAYYAARATSDIGRLAETVRHNMAMESKNFTPTINVTPTTVTNVPTSPYENKGTDNRNTIPKSVSKEVSNSGKPSSSHSSKTTISVGLGPASATFQHQSSHSKGSTATISKTSAADSSSKALGNKQSNRTQKTLSTNKIGGKANGKR